MNQYIDSEVLHNLHKGLETVQYSRVACAIRIKVLQCLKDLLPTQDPPDFYERVLRSFDELAVYFDFVCREEPHIPGPPCDEMNAFRRTLQTCALTTQQLQLSYFRELCQASFPVRRLFKEPFLSRKRVFFSWKIRIIMVKLSFVSHTKSSLV